MGNKWFPFWGGGAFSARGMRRNGCSFSSSGEQTQSSGLQKRRCCKACLKSLIYPDPESAVGQSKGPFSRYSLIRWHSPGARCALQMEEPFSKSDVCKPERAILSAYISHYPSHWRFPHQSGERAACAFQSHLLESFHHFYNKTQQRQQSMAPGGRSIQMSALSEGGLGTALIHQRLLLPREQMVTLQ